MSGYIGKGQPVAVEDGSVEIDDFSATGTASATTFLRGDNSWTTVDTDLVSDTTPKLGGNLDTNGKTLDTVNLEAYSDITSITGNAVDIFIYDTSKDSDGGAWRKRTQDTSWYNEAASSTRGSRKDFPAVAVIVAETNKVTIYDGDTPDLDMWMVFNDSDNLNFIANLSSRDVSSVVMLNGQLIVGKNNCTSADIFHIVDMIGDSAKKILAADAGADHLQIHIGGIVKRNSATGTYGAGNSLELLSNASSVNDVAITVLPNAPIDSATGLPTPTIAVATNGGVSVIKDDGTVVDIISYDFGSISFTEENKLIMVRGASNIVYYGEIPSVDIGSTSYRVLNTSLYFGSDGGSGVDFGITTGHNFVHVSTQDAFATTEKLIRFKKDTTLNNSSVAYITSKYNTGYMTGDIRGAWNVDTDVTTLGTELVTNGTFGSGTGWSAGGNWSISSGVAQITSGSGASFLQQAVAPSVLVAGKQYSVTATVSTTSGSLQPRIANSSYGSSFPNGTSTQLMTAGSTTSETVLFYANSWIGTLDNVSVKEAIPDRSVKGNGLAVHGTPTVSAVATGAELKCISGFTTSNYLEQPYNSDLNFGTGDWSISGWVWSNRTSSYADIISRTANSAERWFMQIEGGAGRVNLYYYDGTAHFGTGWSTTSVCTSSWIHITQVCRGGSYSMYINGNLDTATTSGNMNGKDMTFSNNQKLQLGWQGSYYNYPATQESLALWRVSATAPSAEQIKEIYEAEKPLFQANAKCTLDGTSDSVAAMDYDDSNDELLVGTSTNLSVFKGLRRVDENTNNITEVAQQGGLRVEEY